MLIIARKVGRLANRLLLFAHFIGAAREHGFRVVNPAFEHYARYFPATSRDLFCRFPSAAAFPSFGFMGRSSLYRLAQITANTLHALQQSGFVTGLIRLRRDQQLDLDGPAFLLKMQRHRVLFVQDWFFRSSVDCEKHGDAIRSYFTPWEHHLDRSRALVEPARRTGNLLVGVHIRQGDYSSFKEGRYFYTHGEYRNFMEQIRAIFPERSVSFFASSDAPIPDGVFSGLDLYYGNGHELEDLYALAECDFIIGPPSTYSRWASYYGKVPRLEIVDPAIPLAPELFNVDTRLLHLSLLDSLADWQDPRK